MTARHSARWCLAVSPELRDAVTQAAARETLRTGQRTTAADYVRRAIEDRLTKDEPKGGA